MDASPQGVTERRSGDRGGRLLGWALATGLGLCIAFVATPSSWVVLRELVIYPLAEVVAVTSVLAGVYRYRPSHPQAWLLIGAGLFAFLIADVIWGSYRALDLDPFPSFADVFYLAAYPLFATGIFIATSRRKALGVDLRATIDAAIITVICALIVWVYVIVPVVHDDQLSTLERIVTLLYPLADLLLLAAATRFVTGSSWNMQALRVLVLGFLLLFVGDTIFALNSAGTDQERVWDTALLVGILMIGVAALDPSMRALTEEPGDPAARSDKARRLFNACAILVPPLILIIEDLRGGPTHRAAGALALILVSLLVAARSQFMTAGAERAASREAMLSRYAADLLAAADRGQLFDAARRALSALPKSPDERASLVLDAEHGLPRQNDFSAAVTLRGERVGVIVAEAAPATLRKGPRGGGRDTAKVVDHVNEADSAYAREMGRKHDPKDRAAVEAMRAEMLDVLRTASDGSPLSGRRWTARYAARRVAWHALDHAWEIEDRTER